MTNRQRTPIEGIVRATNTAQADAFLAWLRRMAVATDADSGNITFTLGEKEGETTFRVDDSAHVAQLTLDSDGNLAVKTIAAPEAVWELGEFVEADEEDTMTYAATITLDVGLASFHKTTTVHAVGNATINASTEGRAGTTMWVIIENDATTGKTITFGTKFLPSATVVGTASKTAVLQFVSDGKEWFEASRTLGL